MIQVVNAHWYKGPGEWVDRRHSPLGNPFSHLANTTAKYHVTSREESVERYEPWLDGQPAESAAKKELNRLADIFQKTGDLVLICWCVNPKSRVPIPCHAFIVKDRIIKMVAGNP